VPTLDLKRQYAGIADEVKAAIERVLTTQHFIGGPELEGFERESTEYLDVHASVGCASGTDALWLALLASGIGPDTSVITSPFSFFASVSSIVRCGATPVLADINPTTLNLDPAAVESALKRARLHKVRAIMPVHLYGQCANMDEFDKSHGSTRSTSSKTRRRLSARSGATERPAGWAKLRLSASIRRRT
jgi:dTDP-4-amino-4,6-dideoxygalactose transaminase